MHERSLRRGAWAGLITCIALVAVFFIRSFYTVSDAFSRAPFPQRLKPIVGAAATGAIGIALGPIDGGAPVRDALLPYGKPWVDEDDKRVRVDSVRSDRLEPISGRMELKAAVEFGESCRQASLKPYPAAHVLHPYVDALLRARERAPAPRPRDATHTRGRGRGRGLARDLPTSADQAHDGRPGA